MRIKALTEEKTIKLTPRLFRQLDIITRTEGGCPLEVIDHKEMDGNFAYFSFWVLGVYENRNKKGPLAEKMLIQIANQIDVAKFKTVWRRELDWSKIPVHKIYRFLIFHELGHRLFDIDEFCLPSDILMDIGKRRLFHGANELRADRYAWMRIFPEKPLPIRRENKDYIKPIITFMKSHKQLFSAAP